MKIVIYLSFFYFYSCHLLDKTLIYGVYLLFVLFLWSDFYKSKHSNKTMANI